MKQNKNQLGQIASEKLFTAQDVARLAYGAFRDVMRESEEPQDGGFPEWVQLSDKVRGPYLDRAQAILDKELALTAFDRHCEEVIS